MSQISLAEYKKAIENLAESKDGFIFKNSSPHHAAIVLSALFKYTTGEIRIFDSDLSADIADKAADSYERIKKFVDEGNVLKVVITDGKTRKSQLYQLLQELSINNKNVIVKQVTPPYLEVINKALNGICHFAVANSNGFRLEVKQHSDRELQREAICSFNFPNIGLKLKNLFDQQFDLCDPIFN